MSKETKTPALESEWFKQKLETMKTVVKTEILPKLYKANIERRQVAIVYVTAKQCGWQSDEPDNNHEVRCAFQTALRRALTANGMAIFIEKEDRHKPWNIDAADGFYVRWI